MKSNLFMRKIRNFLCFFICSFHLNCPTTEEQITNRQVLLGVTQKDANRNRRSPSCDRTTPANTHPYLQANLLASIMGENPIGKTNKLGEQHMLALVQMGEETAGQVKRFLDVALLQHPGTHAFGQLMISRLL